MKVTLLKKNPLVYSCNAYLVRGNWNAIDDVNTLIDAGTDGFLYEELQTISTGVGKRRVEQVILTHEHFDHSGGLKIIAKEYKPRVFAFSMIPGVTDRATDGKWVKIGDRDAQILHTPGHSHDSICIYVPEEGVLFSGDTQLSIKTPGGSYSQEYLDVLNRLYRMKILSIYSGHDEPFHGDTRRMLEQTIENVMNSRVV